MPPPAPTARCSILLEGPTAIAFVRDDVGAVAKVLRDFSRVHPELVVKGGLLGTKLVDAQGAGALADLPTREVLLAQLAGAIAAPMRQFAGLLQALPRSLAYGLSALIDKRGGVVTESVEPTSQDEASSDTAEAAVEAGEPAGAEHVEEQPSSAEASPAASVDGGETAENPAAVEAEAPERRPR